MKSKKITLSVLSATMILPMFTPFNIYASECVFTDQDTYIEDDIESYLDGTRLEAQLPSEAISEEPKEDTTVTIETQSDEVAESEPVEEELKNDNEQVEETNSLIDDEVKISEGTTETIVETIKDENNIVGTKEETVFKPSLNIVYYGDNGYVIRNINHALTREIVTRNYEGFLLSGNPFGIGQCTWYAWSRFYQVYGFDSGARGNGKINAKEIVNEHADLFELSDTPATGAVFSMEYNTLYPEYGHVGFVEDFDGEYLWISEGNALINGTLGNIWVHKVNYDDFMAQFPDVVFAVPKEEKAKDKTSVIYKSLQKLTNDERWQ